MSKYLVDSDHDQIIAELENIGKRAVFAGDLFVKELVFACLLDEYLSTGRGIDAIWHTWDTLGYSPTSIDTDHVYLTTGDYQDVYIGVPVHRLKPCVAITLAKSAHLVEKVYRKDLSFCVPDKHLWSDLSRLVNKSHAISCIWRLLDYQPIAKQIESNWR